MKVAVIGGGSWGTALARLATQNGHAVSLWAYEEEVVRSLAQFENTLYLSGIPLPKTIVPSQDMGIVLDAARCVIFAVPAQHARSILQQMAPHLGPKVPIISATKGIEIESLLLMHDVIREGLKRETIDRIAILSGPSFARETALDQPTAVTLATVNHRLGLRLQHLLSTPTFRIFLSEDWVGVGLGGALKNIIAIAAGIGDGLGFGHNTKAILMARGLSEMTDLGVAMGANPSTFYGLSGLGDLFLTCSGAQSRNRQVGEAIGKGMSLDQILKEMKMVAEGVSTTKAVWALSKKYKVTMPIVREVYQVLFQKKSPHTAVLDLMSQAYGKEVAGMRTRSIPSDSRR
jgi:glycerol-3-phosphate dehydrogenase (NAD(P)+)